MKAPRLRAVDARTAANARSIVVIIEFMRFDNASVSLRIYKDARISFQFRTSQLTFSVTATMTRQIPRTLKKMTDRRRPVIMET